MENSREIITMRKIQWEKAKGNLQGFLHTFWIEYDEDNREIDNGFYEYKSAIRSFIIDMERYM